jgi:hypothetical protein
MQSSASAGIPSKQSKSAAAKDRIFRPFFAAVLARKPSRSNRRPGQEQMGLHLFNADGQDKFPDQDNWRGRKSPVLAVAKKHDRNNDVQTRKSSLWH